MVRIHIYGARAILYNFVITKTINMSNNKWKLVYLDQYSPWKKQKTLSENDIHNIQHWRKLLWILFIFMGLRSFSYYFSFAKKLDLRTEKWKLAYRNQYSPIKTHQSIYRTNILILYNMGYFWKNNQIFLDMETFFTLPGFQVFLFCIF